MTYPQINIVIPMAGQGSRFAKAGFDLPKPLIKVDGMTLAEHSIKTLGIDGRFIFITRTFENPKHNEKLTRIFERTCKDFIEIRIDDEHLGAAHSALFAEHYIDHSEPLIITNCDQHLNWNGKDFEHFTRINDKIDGAIVLYHSTDPKNSYAITHGMQVLGVAEKQQISEDALIGVHYWKYAGDFFHSARQLLASYKEEGYPECYVSLTYNYLIQDNKDIVAYFVLDSDFQPLGTPKDVEEYYEAIKNRR